MTTDIHFYGELADMAAINGIVATISEFVETHGWQATFVSEVEGQYVRDDGAQVWIYEGPVSGLEILAHERCEPIRLVFGSDLACCAGVVTEAAPPEIHEAIVELLARLEPHFSRLLVEDVAGAWRARRASPLRGALDRCHDGADRRPADARPQAPLPAGGIARDLETRTPWRSPSHLN